MVFGGVIEGAWRVQLPHAAGDYGGHRWREH